MQCLIQRYEAAEAIAKAKVFFPTRKDQWLFLVPLKGGR